MFDRKLDELLETMNEDQLRAEVKRLRALVESLQREILSAPVPIVRADAVGRERPDVRKITEELDQLAIQDYLPKMMRVLQVLGIVASIWILYTLGIVGLPLVVALMIVLL